MAGNLVFPNLESLLYRLDHIERQISSYLYNIKENFHETRWRIKRLEWYKNRLVFQKIFHSKVFSKKFFKFFAKKKGLDLTLINFWRSVNFRNLCTIEIINHRGNGPPLIGLCRIPLYERPFGLIYKIETKSGCICCVNEKFSEEPIWWDQMNKISYFYQKEIGNKISLAYKKKNFREKESEKKIKQQFAWVKLFFQQKKKYRNPIDFYYKFLKIFLKAIERIFFSRMNWEQLVGARKNFTKSGINQKKTLKKIVN